ncbi:hypothetical protein CC79DRAFT_207640 [Sarocladium strictum]
MASQPNTPAQGMPALRPLAPKQASAPPEAQDQVPVGAVTGSGNAMTSTNHSSLEQNLEPAVASLPAMQTLSRLTTLAESMRSGPIQNAHGHGTSEEPRIAQPSTLPLPPIAALIEHTDMQRLRREVGEVLGETSLALSKVVKLVDPVIQDQVKLREDVEDVNKELRRTRKDVGLPELGGRGSFPGPVEIRSALNFLQEAVIGVQQRVDSFPENVQHFQHTIKQIQDKSSAQDTQRRKENDAVCRRLGTLEVKSFASSSTRVPLPDGPVRNNDHEARIRALEEGSEQISTEEKGCCNKDHDSHFQSVKDYIREQHEDEAKVSKHLSWSIKAIRELQGQVKELREECDSLRKLNAPRENDPDAAADTERFALSSPGRTISQEPSPTREQGRSRSLAPNTSLAATTSYMNQLAIYRPFMRNHEGTAEAAILAARQKSKEDQAAAERAKKAASKPVPTDAGNKRKRNESVSTLSSVPTPSPRVSRATSDTNDNAVPFSIKTRGQTRKEEKGEQAQQSATEDNSSPPTRSAKKAKTRSKA